jgi:hypothetical protein
VRVEDGASCDGARSFNNVAAIVSAEESRRFHHSRRYLKAPMAPPRSARPRFTPTAAYSVQRTNPQCSLRWRWSKERQKGTWLSSCNALRLPFKKGAARFELRRPRFVIVRCQRRARLRERASAPPAVAQQGDPAAEDVRDRELPKMRQRAVVLAQPARQRGRNDGGRTKRLHLSCLT